MMKVQTKPAYLGSRFWTCREKNAYLNGKPQVYPTGGRQIIFQHTVSEKIRSYGIFSVVLVDSKTFSGRLEGQK